MPRCPRHQSRMQPPRHRRIHPPQHSTTSSSSSATPRSTASHKGFIRIMIEAPGPLLFLPSDVIHPPACNFRFLEQKKKRKNDAEVASSKNKTDTQETKEG